MAISALRRAQTPRRWGPNTSATPDGSAAFGNGAVATLTDQQVFGTTSNTYTTPGITSGLSRGRQSGALQVVTTDANGNLATDDGTIYEALSQLQAGVAVSLASANPELTNGKTFAIALNWGKFLQSNALGFSTIGVLDRNLFGNGEQLSISGGFGVSVSEATYGGHTAGTTVGGRASVQLGW